MSNVKITRIISLREMLIRHFMMFVMNGKIY